MPGDIRLRPGIKLLSQKMATNTNAFSLVARPRNSNLLVAFVFVCNTDANAATFNIFHDNNGSTYNNTTALYYNNVINAKTTTLLDFSHCGIALNKDTAAGNLGAQANTANIINFTVYGMETR
jgi:hypothetical protein